MSGRTTPEDAFRAAQARLLAATGTRAVSRAVRVHGRWVHVIEAGAGRPVVLVHGGSAGVAASLAPLMSRLQDGFHLFAPDRPGCGLSDAPSYRGVRLREHAGHFLEGLLEALGLERVNLVGSSMGGYWALAFALTHPEQVQRLVVLGAPAGSARQPSLRERLLATPGVGELLHLAAAPGRAGAAGRLAARHVAHPERLTGAAARRDPRRRAAAGRAADRARRGPGGDPAGGPGAADPRAPRRAGGAAAARAAGLGARGNRAQWGGDWTSGTGCPTATWSSCPAPGTWCGSTSRRRRRACCGSSWTWAAACRSSRGGARSAAGRVGRCLSPKFQEWHGPPAARGPRGVSSGPWPAHRSRRDRSGAGRR